MNERSISPWSSSVIATSPNGQFEARIDAAGEIAMGAPTLGELKLSNGKTYDSCNPSIIWSNDSEHLAIPQWTDTMKQRLLVISMSKNKACYASDEYSVLVLESFENGVITGIDSPKVSRRLFTIDVSQLPW